MRSRPARRALMLLSTALVCVAVAAPAVAAPAKPKPTPPAVKDYPGDPKAASCPAPKVMSKRDVVYGQDPVRKMVALTFDDGPDPRWTPQVLNILKQRKAKATFFVIGENAARYPALMARIHREGHTVANHTWRHGYADTMSSATLRNDLLRTSGTIRKTGAQQRICYFRPPGGRHNGVTDARVKALGMSTVMWSVDTQDWKRPGSLAIKSRAGAARSGDIVLMHDGGGNRSQTVAALPGILLIYAQRGIRTVGINGR